MLIRGDLLCIEKKKKSFVGTFALSYFLNGKKRKRKKRGGGVMVRIDQFALCLG